MIFLHEVISLITFGRNYTLVSKLFLGKRRLLGGSLYSMDFPLPVMTKFIIHLRPRVSSYESRAVRCRRRSQTLIAETRVLRGALDYAFFLISTGHDRGRPITALCLRAACLRRPGSHRCRPHIFRSPIMSRIHDSPQELPLSFVFSCVRPPPSATDP
jgi:hypothetical protein